MNNIKQHFEEAHSVLSQFLSDDINFKNIAKKSLLSFSFHIIEYFFKVSFNFEEIYFQHFSF